MKFITTKNSRKFTLPLRLAIALILVVAVLVPSRASAAQLTSRKLALSTSAGNTSATWTFTFTPSATTALNGITFQVCDAPSGTCTIPGSWTNAGSAFSSLTYNGSSQSSWALDNSTGYLRIKNNTSVATATGPIVTTFNTVTNPNTTNATFYVRVLTYTGDDYTGNLDSGIVAAATTQQITLSGTMDESLVFCVGASGANCGALTSSGGSVSLGSFSSSATSTATSKMIASTNGLSGYTVTVNGSTLTCTACAGTPTIAAMGTQSANGSGAASSIGSAQFGMNLRANATPSVGTDKSGGSGAYGTNYGTADSFRFYTGDSVATASGVTDATTYTVSYIANVPGSQTAGAYTATMTYIATATF